MADRAYEVTERATVYRTYVVFARTRDEAKAKLLAGKNEPHPHNAYSEAEQTRVTDVRRAPDYDDRPDR